MALIGRVAEIKILERILDSDKPEFMALYGRRRVGKTYLIRQFFKGKQAIFFNVTGSKDGTLREQIGHFTKQISQVFLGGLELKPGKNWDETFEKLTKAFEQVPQDKKLILFFDELPWMATRKSRLLQNLDYYWNQFWSNDPRIKLIVCGSAASWIIHKIVKSKGGLHNRITEQIYLEPFYLPDTQRFLKSIGVQFNHRQALLLYMVTGGVPYYLSKVKKGLSVSQVIEDLAFSRKGFLLEEFDNLFASLFGDNVVYIQIVKLLAQHPYGLMKRKLLESIGPSVVGSSGIKKLRELEETGFIMSFKPLYHKKKGVYYRLVDEYTFFYLKWIEPIQGSLQQQALEPGNWETMQNTPEWYSWLGYAFESVCYKHISAVKRALSISPSAFASTWRYVPRQGAKGRGAQIDLLFDRRDDAITICEIKYTNKPYTLNKDYVDNLKRKLSVFKEKTRTKKQLFLAFISAYGIKNNYYAEDMLSGVVTLEDFFKEY